MEPEWPRENAEAVIQAVGEADAIRNAKMVERYRRFVRLWQSRDQELKELCGLKSLDDTVAWSRRGRILGFNGSAVRLRILYSLLHAFRATHFIETGTYHGATAICAHRCFQVPVWSCEASFLDFWVARFLTFGLREARIVRAHSEARLQGSSELGRAIRNGCFPFDLLRPLPLAARASQGGSALP